ncbi:MAG: hypothetical protein D6770_02915 [Anaerolineae bacterium]|nr:MAG: hypothetical protein D6770_02915 [Anaerolineae bacterium]
MRTLTLFSSVLLLTLAACTGWDVQPLPARPTPIPSNTPRVLTPTPIIYYPTETRTPVPPTVIPPSTASPGPEVTASPLTPTPDTTATTTATVTLSPTPEDALTMEIIGCDTSIDISHAMGEVTNAYVLLRNQSNREYSGLCVTLSASDEEREHPDKEWCLATLPAHHQVTLKLTVDTAYSTATYLRAELTTGEGQALLTLSPTSCTDIGIFKPRPDTLGVPEPIP